jgi:hypothetical protein
MLNNRMGTPKALDAVAEGPESELHAWTLILKLAVTSVLDGWEAGGVAAAGEGRGSVGIDVLGCCLGDAY